MKKIILFLFIIISSFTNAQCPVTVTGNPGTICAGSCFTLTASGAQSYTWFPTNSNSSTFSYCIPGSSNSTLTFTVFGSSNGGACVDTQLVTINVNPQPSLTVTASSGTLCSGGSTTLTANGASTYTWAPVGNTSCCIVVSPGSSTTYTVCGANFFGCMACTTLTIPVNPSPSVTFSMTNVSPQVWNATPTYSGGTPPYNYVWSWGDGSPNDVIAYPSHTYTAAAWYNVCVTITDANGCTANQCSLDSLYKMSSNNSMISLNVINGSTGIAQHEKDGKSFYPNPANEQLFFNENINSVEIYDLSGKLVLSKKLSGKNNIAVSNLSEGIYFVRFKNDEVWTSKKLVIAR